MKSKTIEEWVKLLGYLYYHPECEVPKILTELGLKKDATYKTIRTWIAEGKVSKARKTEIIMGKAKELLSLTPEGEALFFRLKEALNKEEANKA